MTALALSRTPKLRKARIAGYRRSVCSGDGASTLAFDAYSFGEWSGEEVVKGVVFEALNLEEEKALVSYVGGTGELKTVEMEVACLSLLGKVGKTMRMRGRIFVPEGDGDTLVGSTRSFVYGEGRLEPEEMDMVVGNGSPVEGATMEQEDDEDDFSETGSPAVVNEHPSPCISPSTSTLNDAVVPHQSLDDLPLPAIDESLQSQVHEHPVDPKIETKDWAATNKVETMYTKDIKDTKIYKELMEMQEPKKVELIGETGEIETTQIKGIEDTKVFKATMNTEEPEMIEGTEEVQETAEITEIVGSNDLEESREIDDIDEGRDTQVETEYQRFLLAEARRARAVSMQAFVSNTVVEVDEENIAPAPATQTWSPTVPWRKEHATAPVRPVLAGRTHSQFGGTTTRMRKTSDSIKSLVEKFENMSPQNTPSKST